MKSTRKKFTVSYSKKDKSWYIRYTWYIRYNEWDDLVRSGHNKEYSIKEARILAKQHEPSQLIIKGKDGKIQKEYTYPRKNDPQRRRG